MHYTAVIFDMGDIFFDATIWRRSLVEYLQQQGIPIDYPEFCRRWEKKLVDVYLGRREYWETFREFLDGLDLAEETAERVTTFAGEQAMQIEDRTLFPGVAETLAWLKRQGLKLAVLSDTESPEERVRRRLADLQIERYFDAVVTSVDIGHVKPEPAAYAAALSRLGTTAEETLFVGHDADELDGAGESGLTTVAYNQADGVSADHYVQRFDELVHLLG